MSQTYQIFTDSSCDLPQERADAYELHVVPLTVQMNGKSYRNELDGREIALATQIVHGHFISIAYDKK